MKIETLLTDAESVTAYYESGDAGAVLHLTAAQWTLYFDAVASTVEIFGEFEVFGKTVLLKGYMDGLTPDIASIMSMIDEAAKEGRAEWSSSPLDDRPSVFYQSYVRTGAEPESDGAPMKSLSDLVSSSPNVEFVHIGEILPLLDGETFSVDELGQYLAVTKPLLACVSGETIYVWTGYEWDAAFKMRPLRATDSPRGGHM